MPRPVKWSRDVHTIRERAARSQVETWSRPDVEHLFGIGPSSAQSLMKAIGDVQTVGGTHFIERAGLVSFLDEMIASPSIEEALRSRLGKAEPPPRSRPLRVTLPPDLHSAMLPDLPANITLESGLLQIRATTAVAMLESLVTLAIIMSNDLDRFQQVVESRARLETDDELRAMLGRMRETTQPL